MVCGYRIVVLSAILMVISISYSRAQTNPEEEIIALRELLKAQTGVQDSGWNHLKIKLGNAYLLRNRDVVQATDSAFQLFTTALGRARQIKHEQQISESMSGLCEVFYRNEDYARGKECFMEVISRYSAEGNVRMQGLTWFKMAEAMWAENFGNSAVYEEILGYHQKAIDILQQCPDCKVEIEHIKRSIADIHMCEGKLDLAQKELTDILTAYDSLNYKSLHFTYYLLAVTSRLKGDMDKSLYYAMQSVDNAEAIGDTYNLSLYLSVVADIYRELDEPEECVKWSMRALYEWEYNNSVGRSYPVRYLHYLCKEMVKIGEGRAAYNRIKDFEKKFPVKGLEAEALMDGAKASVYKAIGNTDLAEQFYLKSIASLETLGEDTFPLYLSEAYQELGTFYYELENFGKSKEYLLRSLDFPSGITAPSKRREVNLILFKADSALGDYQSAIGYYKQFKNLSDEIFNENKSRQIEELRIQYETTRKEGEISNLQNEKALQSGLLRQATQAKNYTLGIVALLLVIMGLLSYSYVTKQKSNRLLISQKNEINQKNKSLQNMVLEKEWLLKEIHHRVKNNLQMVMSLLNTQSYYIDNPHALLAIRNSQHRLHAISLIHQKLYKADDVNTINIAIYIQDLVHYLKDSFEAGKIKFHLEVEPLQLSDIVAIPLGLILNEAIINAIKYGFPEGGEGKITILMKREYKTGYYLLIKDNGIGFSPGFNPEETTSFGINLIKGLSKQLDGRLIIKDEGGVLVEIHFNETEQHPTVEEERLSYSD